MFIKRRKWHFNSPLLSLTVKSSSHHQPPWGEYFIYFIYVSPQVLSTSKGNILLLSKDCKACDCFYKAANINMWELLPLTLFKSLLLLLIHYQDIYFYSHMCMILSQFPITFSGDYCPGLHITCLDELNFQSLLVCWWLNICHRSYD